MARRTSSTLNEQPRGVQRREEPRVQIIVSSPTSSRVFDISLGEVLLLGRSTEVRINVEDSMVSRIHAQIERRADGVWVHDRGSSNGTWVNGKRADSRTRVKPGDEVKLGSTVMAVVESTAIPRYRRSVIDEDELMERFLFEVERSVARGIPLGLISIRPDELGVSREAARARLKDVTGPEHLIGKGMPGELLVVVPEGSSRATEQLLLHLLSTLKPDERRPRGVGVAIFPRDGEAMEDLLESARGEARRCWSPRSVAFPQRHATSADHILTGVPGVSEEPDPDAGCVTRDGAMRRVVNLATKVASADVPVLLTGETGVGKEVLARYIHDASPRSSGPFVKVHCAALPPSLIEAELFGHERGAFTGAEKERVGFFESANGGTLVLDEITEMPGGLQVKLLRFLDDYTVHRVGRSTDVRLDVRVLALTNRDVQEEVGEGNFREDLYYRLSTFVLLVPPLRSRPADISLLAEYFLLRTARRMGVDAPKASEEFHAKLREHVWPGNVRELRNVVEAAVIQCEDGLLQPDLLPPHMGRKLVRKSEPPAPEGIDTVRQKAEVEEIRKALEATGGNQTHAARILGISRRTLWSKIRKYKIAVVRYGGSS
jgi:DNA-binding NtrC family response regulator